MYFPVVLYVSEFHSKFVNSKSNVFKVWVSFRNTVMPAEITSGPIPSAGIEAMEKLGRGWRVDGLIMVVLTK